MNKYVISIDWLSIYCSGIIPENSTERYKIIDAKLPTRQWNRLTYVYDKKLSEKIHLFEIVSQPHLKTIDQTACIIKIRNFALYTRHFTKDLNQLIRELKLQYNGISRIDICADFNKFETCTVQQFYTDFFTNKIIKNGQGKYKAQGQQKQNIHTYTGIKFGSPTSTITTNLYNKTLELKEVKFKKYIFDKWKKCKLETDTDVHRLEFAIHGNIKIVDENGEINPINLNMLENSEYTTNLYSYFYEKYFDFRQISTDTNKSRLKRINLINIHESTFKEIVNLTQQQDAKRSERIFIKKFWKIIQNTDRHPEQITVLNHALDITAHITGLTYYLTCKKKHWLRE
ncbi:MAG: hypothetical protein LBP63_09990 [Prevotellaceae bacterium]|jgi:hypothetical protein|nr:hypothetical protein [Prevotellaceae bacterium]